jgi:hypothetical protein
MGSDEIPSDFYELLGVDSGADTLDIKAAYRKAAREWHPDRNGGDAARFRAVKEAYDVLSDPVAREAYDNTRIAGPYVTPGEIIWTLADGRLPGSVTVRLSNRGDDLPTDIDVAPDSGSFWRVSVPTAVLEGDDLYDFSIVPVSLSTMTAGTYRDELRFIVDGQVAKLSIVLEVPKTATPPPRPPRARLERWPAPPPRPRSMGITEASPRAGASRVIRALLSKLGALIAAVALLALPFGIEALWAPIFNHNQHNLLVDLVGLAIGLARNVQ